MLVPNRYYNGPEYRYGFNGQEKDNEIKGEGNWIHYEFRDYDPRIGRMNSIDPKSSDYSWQSPYVYHRNSPIASVDYLGLGDPPVTAYHNTSIENGAKILNDGTFKAGKSGWNYFMTDPSGTKAGSEVAKSPVQFEIKINVDGAKEISYNQWNGYFNEAKNDLGLSEVANKDLSSEQIKQLNAMRNEKAVKYMNGIKDADTFIIHADKRASGQKFYVLKNSAIGRRVSKTFQTIRGSADISKFISTSTKLSASRWATYGKSLLRLTGEALVIEGVLLATQEYVKAQADYEKNKLDYKEYNKKYNTNYTEKQYNGLVKMGESSY